MKMEMLESLSLFLNLVLIVLLTLRVYSWIVGYFPKTVYIYRLNASLPLPKYETKGAACMDVYSNKATTILPGETQVIPLGIHVAIPRGYEIQVRCRSGLAAKWAISITNGIGTIDSDYRGECGIILTNLSSVPYVVGFNERIGQIALNKVETIKWFEVDDLSDLTTTVRGSGGFGHTGK